MTGFSVHVGQQVAEVALNPTPGGGVVACGGERQPRPVRQRVDALNEPLAPRALTNDQAAVMVLDGAGDDLRGGGRAPVDEHDERLFAGGALAPAREILRGGGGGSARGND